jgi:ElaB/YqjD/DUF883 family membrane-anchored ribosome-binding protein
MKLPKIILPFLLLIAASLGACDKSSTSADSTPSTAGQQLDQLKQDTSNAAQDMKNYTFTEKDAFVAKMQTELDSLNQELAALSAKIANASDAVKADAQPKLDALRVKIAELGPELDKAKNSTESTWDEVKGGTQKAFDSTTDAFKEAGLWLDNKLGIPTASAPAAHS